MNLQNQCMVYEKNKGDTELVCEKWIAKLTSGENANGRVSYKRVLKNYREISRKKADDFQNRALMLAGT